MFCVGLQEMHPIFEIVFDQGDPKKKKKKKKKKKGNGLLAVDD